MLAMQAPDQTPDQTLSTESLSVVDIDKKGKNKPRIAEKLRRQSPRIAIENLSLFVQQIVG